MEIIIRTFLCLTTYSHLLSITALYYEENSQLYYQQQKYIPGCRPGIEYVDNGAFIIEQNIAYNLECQPGFILPFESKTIWYCNSSNLRPNNPETDTDDEVEYTLKDDSSFRVDACPEGSLVESSEVNFDTKVPICRMCSVGMFVDMKLKRCMPCKVGYSDFPGATSCKPCPVVMAEADRSSESITGCYVDIDSQPDRTDTIREGIIFFVFFHFTMFCVVTWKIKYFHPLAY